MHDLAVGHRPPAALNPESDALFRAFQSNLLSLLSHELRTPLMGILNALTMLEDKGGPASVPEPELISMARRNAQRLEAALAALLDLAAIDSGTYHAKVREVNLSRLVHGRVRYNEGLLRDKNLRLSLQDTTEGSGDGAVPVLADPQKLGRAVDLCVQGMVSRAQAGSTIELRLDVTWIEFVVCLAEGAEKPWETAWTQALAGFESGVMSPRSAFAGVLQPEQAFLSRVEEGLGSELMLVHEIMRLHRGSFKGRTERKERVWRAVLRLELPNLSEEESLNLVLASRAAGISAESGALGCVALGLVRAPEGMDIQAFRTRIKNTLFRATDSAYALPEKGLVAIVLDDCKAEDAPRLIARISEQIGLPLQVGIAVTPRDAVESKDLIVMAEKRLAETGA